MRSSGKLALAIAAIVTVPTIAASATSPPLDKPPKPDKKQECAGRLCAGAGKADITPQVGTPMWGYSSRAFYAEFERWADQRVRWIDTDLYAKVLFMRSEGVHTRLYARTLVLQNAASVKIALVQTDLGAVTGELHKAVANEVASLGIERDHLLISATHTHGGPGASQQPPAHGLLVGDTYDPRVFARIVAGIVAAIEEANGSLAPARAAIGQGLIPDASINRSDGPHLANPCPDPQAIEDFPCDHTNEDAASDHATDPIVTVLRVDRVDGLPLGVWTVFAAHGTMFWGDDVRFSGDHQGYAERMIENAIAARAEAKGIELTDGWDVVAAFANDTEGDQAPVGAGKNRFVRAEDAGRREAQGVLTVYDALEAQLQDDIALGSRWDWMYMTGDEGTSPIAILGAGPDCPFGTGPFPDEGVPGHGRKCPFLVLSGTGPNWFGIQVLRLGDVAVAAFPGEPTVQFGRRLRKRILTSTFNDGEAQRAVVIGLANDYMAYTTTPEEYDLQWYEGTFTLWGRNQANLFIKRFGALADALFGGPEVAYAEPPDTSFLQSENTSPSQPLSPVTDSGGPAPGTVLSQPPAPVERGSVVAFAWVGGEPSVELVPDEPFVITQRLETAQDPGHGPPPDKGPPPDRGPPPDKGKPPTEGTWVTAFTDEGYADLLDYWREGVVDRWGTQWDVTFDAPAGTYRFVIRGHAWEGGDVADYEVVSIPFEVRPSDDIDVTAIEVRPEGIVVMGAYPEPSASDHENFGQPPPYVHDCSAARPDAPLCGNYRWRPTDATTGQVTVEIVGADGAVRTATGSYDPAAGGYLVAVAVQAGEQVRVPAGGLIDGWGNFNGAAESTTVTATTTPAPGAPAGSSATALWVHGRSPL